MRNIVDYAREELQTFDKLAFSGVDSLVLCQLSYMHLGEAVPEAGGMGTATLRDLFKAELFDVLYGDARVVEPCANLLCAVAASPRFRDIHLGGYTNEVDPGQEKQFSAETYLLPSGDGFIAFRGTDDTIVGWKEDFNMAFESPVPAQRDAASYLEMVASYVPGKLYVGGHSKGGNLAVYASAMCKREVQDRIVAVFDHDGPGFDEGLLSSDEFARIQPRTHKTMPKEALVGMLFEYQGDYSIVDSNGIGILQHDAFTWKIDGDDFAYVEHISLGAAHNDEVLHQWIAGLTREERAIFSDTMYQVIQASGATRISELSRLTPQQLASSFEAFSKADPEMRKVVRKTFLELAQLQIALPSKLRAAGEEELEAETDKA